MICAEQLQPGDLVILRGQDGLWKGSFEYLAPDPDDEAFVRVGDLENNGLVFSVNRQLLVRPTLTRPDDTEASESPGDQAADGRGDDPLTDRQRRCLFALGKARGFNVDDLRAMTPAGSISALSRAEAARLIDRLQGQPETAVEADPSRITPKQRAKILHLRKALGFTAQEFSQWLQKRFEVARIDEVTDRYHASKIIGGLVKMQQNLEAKEQRQASDPAGGEPDRPVCRHLTNMV